MTNYLKCTMPTKDLPVNWTSLFGKKYVIIGFSFGNNGEVEVEFCECEDEEIEGEK